MEEITRANFHESLIAFLDIVIACSKFALENPRFQNTQDAEPLIAMARQAKDTIGAGTRDEPTVKDIVERFRNFSNGIKYK